MLTLTVGHRRDKQRETTVPTLFLSLGRLEEAGLHRRRSVRVRVLGGGLVVSANGGGRSQTVSRRLGGVQFGGAWLRDLGIEPGAVVSMEIGDGEIRLIPTGGNKQKVA